MRVQWKRRRQRELKYIVTINHLKNRRARLHSKCKRETLIQYTILSYTREMILIMISQFRDRRREEYGIQEGIQLRKMVIRINNEYFKSCRGLMRKKVYQQKVQQSFWKYYINSNYQLNQVKDVSMTDLREFNNNQTHRFGIIGTIYSSQHGWKVCKDLQKHFLNVHEEYLKKVNLEIEALDDQIIKADPLMKGQLNLKKNHFTSRVSPGPFLSGRKDDEWIMVSYKEYMVHLFTEEYREEICLEHKWRHQPDEHQLREFERLMKDFKKSKKGLFQPLGK